MIVRNYPTRLFNKWWLGRQLRGIPSWTPAALFAQGQQGAWYEPKPEYLYQDAAGTTPVTADGQPVGYMEDLSGNGNHAIASAATNKPLYRTDGTLHWLEFDTVDDHLLFTIPYSLFVSGLSYYLGYDTQSESSGMFYSKNNGSSPWAFFFQETNTTTSITDITASDEPAVSLTVDGSSADTTNRNTVHNAVTGKHVLGWDASGATGDYVSSAGHGIGNYNNGAVTLSGNLYGVLWRSSFIQSEKDSVNSYLANLAGVTL